jgi:hypothetical protein
VSDKPVMSADTQSNGGAAATLEPDAASSGGGYVAVLTSGDRTVWSCRHVHFTEHSAKACAEHHLPDVADKPFTDAYMYIGSCSAADSKPGVAPSGAGYRAIVSRDGHVAWSCPHVHFTDHSARTCAEQHLGEGAARP